MNANIYLGKTTRTIEAGEMGFADEPGDGIAVLRGERGKVPCGTRCTFWVDPDSGRWAMVVGKGRILGLTTEAAKGCLETIRDHKGRPMRETSTRAQMERGAYENAIDRARTLGTLVVL